MKNIVLIAGLFFVHQIFITSFAEAQEPPVKGKNQKKVVAKASASVAQKSSAKPVVPAKTLAPPPSAQSAAAAMPVAKPEPVVILPPMGDYKYELNMAPLALLDFLKYDSSSESDLERQQFGYGVSAVSFIRNSNDLDDTFPSRAGYSFGATAVWDHRDYYYATHAYYEKFERYQDQGTLVQEREGFRVNAVMGLKEVIKRRFALKFGWGLEAQTYRVREFHETNRFVQSNYQTNILNPFFLECKLAMYF